MTRILQDYRYYLRMERKLSPNTVAAYGRDVAELLAAFSLPTRVADLPGGAACGPDALFAAMLSDKKKLGAKIHFVLLEGWGRAKAVPLDPAAVRGALAAVL